MKKLFLILLILPHLVSAQFDALANKKIDSVRQKMQSYVDSSIKALKPSAVTNNVYVDSSIAKLKTQLVSVYSKTYTSNLASGFFKLDTFTAPINTSFLFNYTLTGTTIANGAVKTFYTEHRLVVTNNNGTYLITDNPIVWASFFTTAPDKTGAQIWITPGSGLINWIETYTKQQL